MKRKPYDRMVTATINRETGEGEYVRVFLPRWWELGRWLYWLRLPRSRKRTLQLGFPYPRVPLGGFVMVRAEVIKRGLSPRDSIVAE